MTAGSTSPSDDPDFLLILFVTTVMIFVFVAFIVITLFLYQRRFFKHQRAVAQMKQDFQTELLTTQLEIQEQTFRRISEDLHDNIGQVLSFIKLTLNSYSATKEELRHRKVEECQQLVGDVITDVRDLSKSLSTDFISKLGLRELIKIETERVRKSGLITPVLAIEGEEYELNEQDELILFRIFQESLNNTLKYSRAKSLNIHLKYGVDLFNLTLSDDGIGFDPETKTLGSGLTNMRNRARLIGAETHIISQIDQGCRIEVVLDPKRNHHFTP